MICLVYVDDTIIYIPNKKAIKTKIKILGVSSDKHRQKFELRDESEVGDFLELGWRRPENHDYI